MRKWYEHFASIGIEYENEFQRLDRIFCGSLHERQVTIVDTNQSLCADTTPVDIARRDAFEPLSIDAMFQAALIASTGILHSAAVPEIPLFVNCFTVDITAFPGRRIGTISATSACPGADEVDVIMRDSSSGTSRPIAVMSGLRMGSIRQESNDSERIRHPISKIHWKPNISFVQAQKSWQLLEPHLSQFIRSRIDLGGHENCIPDLHLAYATDLLAHQRISSRIRIVSESKDDCLGALLRDILRVDSIYARCEAITWISPENSMGACFGRPNDRGEDCPGEDHILILKVCFRVNLSWIQI